MFRIIKGSVRKSELVAQLAKGSRYDKEEKLILTNQSSPSFVNAIF